MAKNIVKKLTSGLTPSFAGGLVAPGQTDELQSDFGPIVQQITGAPMQAPRQNFLLPEPGTDGFFGQHPHVAQGIENALLALANTHGGETVGDSISNIAAGLFSVPQARRQYQSEQIQSQIGAAGQLAQMRAMIAPQMQTTPYGVIMRDPMTGKLSPGMSPKQIAGLNGAQPTQGSATSQLSKIFPDANDAENRILAGYGSLIDNEPNPEKATQLQNQAIAHIQAAREQNTRHSESLAQTKANAESAKEFHDALIKNGMDKNTILQLMASFRNPANKYADTAIDSARRLSQMQTQAADPSGASDMALLFNHIAMTGGNVKGMRMGETLTTEHMKARSIPEELGVLYNKAANGQQLSPVQRANFVKLAKEVHQSNIDSAKAAAQLYGAQNIPAFVDSPLITPGAGAKSAPAKGDPLGIR